MAKLLNWDNPRPLTELQSHDLEKGSIAFHHDDYIYLGTGDEIGQGGMGIAFEILRRPHNDPDTIEKCVGKVFHDEYLLQIRTDPITQRDHGQVINNIDAISQLNSPHLLPTLISCPIVDNHLCVTPRKIDTLHGLIAQNQLSPRHRVSLLIQALHGVAALHHAGFVHRDVTLRNILVDDLYKNAFLFDFDLTLSTKNLSPNTYHERYEGRIFGSPGYSVAPETLASVLMDLEISTSLDVYAIGGAIFSLFTDQLPYGDTEDMWGLLLRIADGIVLGSESRVVYPDSVPTTIRPLIEGCLERNPRDRFSSVDQIIDGLEQSLTHLSDSVEENAAAAGECETLRSSTSLKKLVTTVACYQKTTVNATLTRNLGKALTTRGYEVLCSLGRVKKQPIFLVEPIPKLVATGKFPDTNTYPKIVTALDLAQEKNPAATVEMWMKEYLPVLRATRQGLLTALYRVIHDDESNYLLLFTEFVDDARYGTDLDSLDLSLYEAFSLGYIAASQIQLLHSRSIAHNNVSAASLIMKGMRAQRMVRPAMVGLVDPSKDKSAIIEDVSRLSELVAKWIKPSQIEATDEFARARLLELWSELQRMASGTGSPKIDTLVDIFADALSAIDFNFGVLRENQGDLEAYALLLLSMRLYGRLWD